MQSIGFVVGKASPCNFHHPRLDITCTVRGDDFTSFGPEVAIEWLRRKIADKYESKHDVLGPGPKHSKSIRVLNRVLSWTGDGITYEAQRHADIVIQELGLKEGKVVTSPSCKEDADRILADVGSPLPRSDAEKKEVTGECAHQERWLRQICSDMGGLLRGDGRHGSRSQFLSTLSSPI